MNNPQSSNVVSPRCRRRCISCVLPLLLLAAPTVGNAQINFTFYCSVSNGVVTITGFGGPPNFGVTIPSTIGGLPVTAIGDYAFLGCYVLGITIPDSVTNIGIGAFAGCNGLGSIRVDPLNPAYSSLDGILYNKSQTTLIQCPTRQPYCTVASVVTNIDSLAFYGCEGLTGFWVDPSNPAYCDLDGVLFNKSHTTLIRCPGMKQGNYTVPNGVTNIAGHAFDCSYFLANVVLPDGVASIGNEAFTWCTGLTSVTIPNSVTSIPNEAFAYCTGLTSVTIPNGVTNIGDKAFFRCSSLKNVTVVGEAIPYRDGSLAGAIGNQAFQFCTSLNDLTIPNTVASIGNFAFYDCIQLTKVIIPDSVITIGFEAFATSINLTNVTIGSRVSSIGDGAFAGRMTSLTIPNTVTNLGDAGFGGCTNLSAVYFEGNAPQFGLNAFWASSNATVYYLSGTTGWSSTFDDRPTAPWVLPNPVILDFGRSFGVQSNGFGFIVSWATHNSVIVEATTDLTSWLPLQTNNLSGGWSYFSDPRWTNNPARFYRVRSP